VHPNQVYVTYSKRRTTVKSYSSNVSQRRAIYLHTDVVVWQGAAMTLPKSMELQWKREVIEKWLNTPSIPFDARAGLLEMLKEVKEEMGKLEAARSSHFNSARSRQAS
jgi:hypothetical protein